MLLTKSTKYAVSKRPLKEVLQDSIGGEVNPITLESFCKRLGNFLFYMKTQIGKATSPNNFNR